MAAIHPLRRSVVAKLHILVARSRAFFFIAGVLLIPFAAGRGH
jgi:hypothetical protein